MTAHHYSEPARFRAICGQVADGVDHMNESAPVLRVLAELGRADVCPTCLAFADEKVQTSAKRYGPEPSW